MNTLTPISLHGGHSGQFCCHAEDSLEQMIQAYISKGFDRVGITEHMPMPADDQLYPDEQKLGLGAQDLMDRFDRYFTELARLKFAYRDRITIYRGFETEVVTGAIDLARQLIKTYAPDYIVGSIHHVSDRCFDYSSQDYMAIAQDLGSIDEMYLAYFDQQFDMIQVLHPFVVGHFDIIRIYDDDYLSRLQKPAIMKKIQRNLDLIKDLGLVLDFNLRPLARGNQHPYLAPVILEKAQKMGIPVVPGDDAHSAQQAGGHVNAAVRILQELGFSTTWPVPRLLAGSNHPDQ